MAAGAAAGDGMFRSVFGGCISGEDMGVRRRPYHRNCSCALHKPPSGEHCPHHLPTKVTYPVRRSFSEGCLVAMKASGSAAASPGSNSPCCPSTPAAGATSTVWDLSPTKLPPHLA